MKDQSARFQAAELEDMLALARQAADGYAPAVLRSDLLSVGLYTLAAGAIDAVVYTFTLFRSFPDASSV